MTWVRTPSRLGPCELDTGQSAPSTALASDAIAALTNTPADELARCRAQLQVAAEHAALRPGEIQQILNSRHDLPRPLLSAERQVLTAVLEHAAFTGRDELRAQVDHTSVVGHCGCGCASVRLRVDHTARSAGTRKGRIPNHAVVFDDTGTAIGGIAVFVSTVGTLWLLEIHSRDTPLSPFPAIDQLELATTPDAKPPFRIVRSSTSGGTTGTA